MATISAFRVTKHSQIFSLFFRNRIQCIALYQLYNSQAPLNLRLGYYSDKNVPSTPIFDNLNVLKFNDMITMQIASFVYECVRNLSPAYFSNYFIWIKNVHSFGTRQSRRVDMFALRCNTTQYGLQSIHYSGVRLWNSLPTDIRNLVSLFIFRSKIKFTFYQIMTQFDTYLHMYIIYKILINVLTCEILQTYISSILS